MNIFNNSNNYNLCIEEFCEIARGSKYLCLFGAGRLGILAYNILKEHIDISFFSDNNKKLWGENIINDICCISPEELIEIKEDVLIVVTIENYSIYEQLKRLGINDVYNIYWFKYDNKSFFNKINVFYLKEEVEKLCNILEDDKSKEIIYASLERWSKSGLFYKNLNELIKMYGEFQSENEYFDPSIIGLNENEVYIDAGAYDGDTIEEFLKVTKNKFEKIIGFELEKGNFSKLAINISKYPEDITKKIELYNKGLYNENTFVSTTSERDNVSISNLELNESSKDLCEVIKLDTFLNEEQKVTYIKMDIEGSEVEALFGMVETIKKWKPKLAICIYHKPEHFWQIPLFIKNLVPEYKIYIRHHSQTTPQTVCYAVL